jgi:hypothetical protein
MNRLEIVDDIEHFWSFWSVRFGSIAAACASALGAYAGAKAFGFEVVAHVPQWLLAALVYGSMAGSFGAVISRRYVQPGLMRPDQCPTP